MNGILGVGVGLAGGFVLARVLEARSAGVPIELALKLWDTPIQRLVADMQARSRPAPAPRHPLDPDAPMPPTASFYRDDE